MQLKPKETCKKGTNHQGPKRFKETIMVMQKKIAQ